MSIHIIIAGILLLFCLFYLFYYVVNSIYGWWEETFNVFNQQDNIFKYLSKYKDEEEEKHCEKFQKFLELKIKESKLKDEADILADVFFKNRNKFIKNGRFVPRDKEPYQYSKLGPFIEKIPGCLEISEIIEGKINELEQDLAEIFWSKYEIIQSKYFYNVQNLYIEPFALFVKTNKLFFYRNYKNHKYKILKKFLDYHSPNDNELSPRDEKIKFEKAVGDCIENSVKINTKDLRKKFVSFLFFDNDFWIYFKHPSSSTRLVREVEDIDNECNPIVLIDGIETTIEDYEIGIQPGLVY